MNNKEKALLGENYVEKYLKDQGYIVRRRIKGEVGFDLFAEKDGKTSQIEVKTSENLRGGIPDMHDTEFSRVGDEWLFTGDYLYVVRIKDERPYQLDILTKAEINAYSKNHATVTKIRTMRLDTDLRNKKVGLTILL